MTNHQTFEETADGGAATKHQKRLAIIEGMLEVEITKLIDWPGPVLNGEQRIQHLKDALAAVQAAANLGRPL